MIQQFFTSLSGTFEKLLGIHKLSREMQKVLLIVFAVLILVQALVVTNVLLLVALLRVILQYRL